MTLERVGATYLVAQRVSILKGDVLELGVGDDPYRAFIPGRVTSLDIRPHVGPHTVGDAHALPFSDDSFDTALASQVFEHLHDPAVAAAELNRVLRPGGRLVVAVPFLFWLHERPHDYFRYTEWGLRRLFGDHFTIDELVPYGGKLAAAADMLFSTTTASSIPRRALRRVRKTLFGPGTATIRPRTARALLRRPGDHPLGYVLVATTR